MSRLGTVGLALLFAGCGGAPFSAALLGLEHDAGTDDGGALEAGPDAPDPVEGSTALDGAADAPEAGVDAASGRDAGDAGADAAPDATHDAGCDDAGGSCVVVPSGWTLAEGDGLGEPAVSCDSWYQGGTVTTENVASGPPTGDMCPPSVAPVACSAAGACAPRVSAHLRLCVYQAGVAPTCPSSWPDQFAQWIGPTAPITVCCLP